MEDIKKEFTTWLAKYEDFYNPEIGTDDLWIWIEQKIKDAKEEGFQAGCDYTCKQYGDGKTENQIKIEGLQEFYNSLPTQYRFDSATLREAFITSIDKLKLPKGSE